MSNNNQNNLRTKRKYLLWLKDARGLSEASVDKAAASISTYETFLKGKDYRVFHSEQARAFKRYLTNLRNEKNGAPLSASTIGGILRDLKAFYSWLCDQAGYKSRLIRSDVDYLTPDKKAEQARRSSLFKPHPSPEQARHVLTNMPSATVIERRDRALLAFLFLTASREGAAITIQIGHVDLINRFVNFDGRNVNTKFGKSFTTAFYPIGKEFENVLADWISELKRDHLFCSTDPLFPKTKIGIGRAGYFEALGIERSPWSSASSLAKIFKGAFAKAGLPPFSPHRVRDCVVDLANAHCKTPEDFKAWSQNMGHDDVLTTFSSYGTLSAGRQVELMQRFADSDDFDVIEKS